MSRHNLVRIAVIALSLGGYIYLGYFTKRSDFAELVPIYFLLFGLYLFICYGRFFSFNVRLVIGVALLLRVSLIMMAPNLTDDYFRYIWDGLLVANGHSPYLATPSDLIAGLPNIPGITPALFEQLNSPTYYSAYPPMAQYIFALSAKIGGSNVLANIIVMRVLTLLAEFGTIIILNRLTKHFRLEPKLVFLYAFNPLVIIELTGNLHLEGITLFFLVLAVYLIVRNRQMFSGAAFALAVGVKLVPLVFLPLFIKRLGVVKSLKYYAIVGISVLLLSVPFLNVPSFSNYFSSLSLYFRAFEFNGSVYYIARWLGSLMNSPDFIARSSLFLGAVSLVAIIIYSVREKKADWPSLFAGMLFSLTVYYLLSTNVYAWNLAPLVLAAVFTDYRYVLPWSLLVVLTYATYQAVPYSENLWLVAIEYLAVAGWLVYEIWVARKRARELRAPV